MRDVSEIDKLLEAKEKEYDAIRDKYAALVKSEIGRILNPEESIYFGMGAVSLTRIINGKMYSADEWPDTDEEDPDDKLWDAEKEKADEREEFEAYLHDERINSDLGHLIGEIRPGKTKKDESKEKI